MQRVKVLPVYPKFPETFWGYRISLGMIRKKAVMPPTGLATVLSMLPQDRFTPLKIIDLNVEPLKDEDIRNSDIVFTSTMVVQEDSHNEVIDRAHFYGKKVVAGGPFPTSYYGRNKGADHIIGGEAEITLPPFLEDLLNGTAKRVYTERDVIREGRNVSRLTRTGKPDITATPLPRWDLVDLDRYFSISLQYSRGCPFDCEFCDITKLYGREPRTKSPQQMISEFEAVYKLGHSGEIFIVDDNFIGNRRNLKEFLPALARWQQDRGFPFVIATETSIDLAEDGNRMILDGMVKAGFNQTFIGIESVDMDVLTKMNKKKNTQTPLMEAVRKIQRAGLEVTGGFIIGSDGEKPDVFESLFNFIQEAGIVIAMPGLLTVPKGTKLYKRLEAEGRLTGEPNGSNTHRFAFDFKTELDEEFLIKGYKELIKKLYAPRNYYDRTRTLQYNIGEHRKRRRYNLEGFRILGRSLRKQFLARGGWEYFKYLVETAVKKPGYFPEAVTKAVKLAHFQDLTKATIEADDYIPETEKLYEQFIEKAGDLSRRHKHNRAKIYRSISKTGRKIVSKAERKYGRLHQGTRDGAEKALDRLKENIRREVEKYLPRTV